MTPTTLLPEPKLDAPGRGRIYESIVETIANTPLVRIKRFCEAEKIPADILLKLEFFNPLASVKDRIGVGMVLQLERDGKIKPGATLIEPTSGNTGIGLAFVGAARGYRVILVMPDSMSIERRKMLAFLGAELHLTPRAEGMPGAMKRVQELLAEISGSVMPGQFSNPANPAIHAKTTAEEIWKDTGGALDAIVSGIGTGGTFTGTGKVLKPRKPSLKMVAVEPELSAVLSGGKHSPHVIQGIGAGIIPDILDRSLIDQIITVGNEESISTARKLARIEGIPTGISSGAALAAACKLARQPEMAGKMIVTIIPDFAERYISTVLFEGIG
jgi:cysteine synthase A